MLGIYNTLKIQLILFCFDLNLSLEQLSLIIGHFFSFFLLAIKFLF